MLVLTRKAGEEIVVNVGHVTVQFFVLSMGNNKVRVGITAPAEADIYRREVLERHEEQQERGAMVAPPQPRDGPTVGP